MLSRRILLVLSLLATQASASWLNPGEDKVAESIVDNAVKAEEASKGGELADESEEQSSSGDGGPTDEDEDTYPYDYDEETGLDVTRGEAILEVNRRKGGVTYLDTFTIHTDSDIEMFGKHVTSIVDMSMKMESTVEDLAEGGQAVDAIIKSVEMSMSTPPSLEIACNTETDDTEEASPACLPLYSMVGTSNHYVVDDEGNIAESSEDEPTEEANNPLGNLQPSNQMEQTSRLLQLVPSHPVKPGESWDASADMGDMGSFVGDGTLVGYKNYEGTDCAVIQTEGLLTVDIAKAAAAMGGGGATPGAMDLGVEDGATMTSTMYYDYAACLPVWSETEVEMVMTMPNPISDERMEIPVHEIVQTVTEIKAD